jgi:hypothetical protein
MVKNATRCRLDLKRPANLIQQPHGYWRMPQRAMLVSFVTQNLRKVAS